MKVGAVSGDLLVKIGLGAVVLAGLIYGLKKAKDTIASVDLSPINPGSPDNVLYATISQGGAAVVTSPTGPGKNADGSWSLGGWLYDVTHSDPLKGR